MNIQQDVKIVLHYNVKLVILIRKTDRQTDVFGWILTTTYFLWVVIRPGKLKVAIKVWCRQHHELLKIALKTTCLILSNYIQLHPYRGIINWSKSSFILYLHQQAS